ncbi:MAG: ribosome-binding factor A [Gemmatales bacterium]|nr:MAG: ribosome-binding factor A [Gemmatales bacterium]
MKSHRLARVAEVVREVASETILFELRDPRIKGVTVTRAEVSGDLQHAKVFVSIMGTQKEQDLCMHGLAHAAGFVQSKLAGRLKTRFTPVIRFVVDHGVKHSIEISRLINEALAENQEKSSGETETETRNQDTGGKEVDRER